MKRKWLQNSGAAFLFSVAVMLSVFATEGITAGIYDYTYKGTALVSPPVNPQYERYTSVIVTEGDKIKISCDFTDSKEHPELSSILIEKWEYNFWNGWNPEYSKGSAYVFWAFAFISCLLFVIGVILEIKDQLAFNTKSKYLSSISAIPVSQYTVPVPLSSPLYSQSADGYWRMSESSVKKLTVASKVLEELPSPPRDVYGVIAYRHWNYNGGYLRSIGVTYEWKNKIENTDPLHSNRYGGLHAYKINDILIKRNNNGVTGLVEMRGKVIEHSDGVLRSEWARILILFCHDCNNPPIFANALSRLYDVPIVDVPQGVFLTQEWIDKMQEGYRWVKVQI